MNKLFNQLNPLNQRLPANIQSMIKVYKGITNPQQAAEQAINNNPQLKSLLQASGGNPEQAFRSMAKQMNIDADEFINMLK